MKLSLFALLAVVGSVAAQCPGGYKLAVWEDRCLCQSGSNMRVPDRSCTYELEGGTCHANCPKSRWGGRGGGRKQEPMGGGKKPPSDCPTGMQSCPISPVKDLGFECVTPLEDIDNCGGCVSLGQGVACSSLVGSEIVECVNGECKIRSCKRGFRLDAPQNICIDQDRIDEMLYGNGHAPWS